MNDRRSAAKRRQDDAAKRIIDQLSISLAAHPGVQMKRLFVCVGGEHGVSGTLIGHDEDSLTELIDHLTAIKERGLDDLPNGPGVDADTEADYPKNVICFPPDRGWS